MKEALQMSKGHRVHCNLYPTVYKWEGNDNTEIYPSPGYLQHLDLHSPDSDIIFVY